MKEPATFKYDIPTQKPYALYIHGLGSSAASGTKSSLARSLDGYEWLAPEITHNPFESLDILNEWVATFQPALVAGTSMGGLLTMYVNSPNAIKVAVNSCVEIERVLRKIGYGKHPYLQLRENGETEYIIDEPMIRQFITFRETNTPILGTRNIALFSTDDELIGREFSKKNAALLGSLGYEIYWNAKFGHRCNEQAAKQIKVILSEA